MDYGKLAYEAYCRERKWVSFNGERLPHFEEQSPELQEAWRKAADAVRREIDMQSGPG